MPDGIELRSERGSLGRSGPQDFTDPRFSEPQVNPEFFGVSSPEALKISRRGFLKTAGGALLAAAAACGPQELSPTPLGPPSPIPRPPATESAPTPKPTDVPLPTKPGAGGEYTAEQLAQIENDPGVQKNIADLTRWVQYYGSAAADRPFSPVSLPGKPGESATLHFKYVQDTKTGKWVAVLESTDTPYVGYIILPPIDTETGTFMESPPPFSGGQIIPDNLKPTFLSIVGKENDPKIPTELVGSIIALTAGQWIRVDEEGNMVGELDMKLGKWVEQLMTREQIEVNIEAFKAMDTKEFQNYIKQYGWKWTGGGTGTKVITPPELAYEAPDGRLHAFAFTNITPNLGLLAGTLLGPTELLNTRTKAVTFQGILLGLYNVPVNGDANWFMITGHQIGKERFVLVESVAIVKLRDQIDTQAPFSFQTTDQRVFSSMNSTTGHPINETLEQLRQRIGQVIAFTSTTGVGYYIENASTRSGKIPHDELTYPTDDPDFLSWRNAFAVQHELNPEDVDAFSYSALQGAGVFYNMRSLYLREAQRLGWGIDRSDLDFSKIVAQASPSESTLDTVSPESLFLLRSPTYFDILTYPFAHQVFLFASDPPLQGIAP